jgi:hypothetical protein
MSHVAKTNPEVDHASVANESTFDKKHGKVKEIQGDAHFHETITAAPLNPWSKTSIQLYFILLVAALNATASGFDGVGGCTMAKNWALPYLLRTMLIFYTTSPSLAPSMP